MLLRGPQTPGELKAHSGRLHEFLDTTEVEAALTALLERPDGPLVARLPREPRRKDHAYAHLFGGPIESVPPDVEDQVTAAPRSPTAGPTTSALEALEARVAELERALAELKQALGVS